MTTTISPVPLDHHSPRPWAHLVRHYLEMVVAMFVGMGVLGLARSAVGLHVSADTHLELSFLLMAFDMSVGMAVAMRLRRHRWARTLEMCAVMFVPAALFPLVWVGALSSTGFMVIAHIAMFVLMLAVMLWRRDEYTHHHRADG